LCIGKRVYKYKNWRENGSNTQNMSCETYLLKQGYD
jgi:hypothetical protein